MKIKSTILTAINTVQLPFKEQITAFKGIGDTDFLQQFVSHMHKNAELHVKGNEVEAYTKKGSYLYIIHPEYIRRINLNNQSRKTFKIS